MSQKDHIIHLKNGRLSNDTPVAQVSQIAQKALANTGDGGIVIHFHGGLVSYSSGVGIADRLISTYKQGSAYPIFFVWESGLLETLRNNLGEIAKEKFFRLLWKRISRIVFRKLKQSAGDRAAFALPDVDFSVVEGSIDDALDQDDLNKLSAATPVISDTIEELSVYEQRLLENELMLDVPLMQEIQLLSNGLRDPLEIETDKRSRKARIQGSTRTLMDPDALDLLVDRPQEGARGIISTAKMIKGVIVVTAKVIKRFVQKRHHGFHATVIEEILRELYLANVGEAIWGMMKKDTADSFGDDPQIHGGTVFLNELSKLIDLSNLPRITLVGHSTGAIYISEFLKKAVTLLPNIFFNIIFLAPASTFEKTAATLNEHLNIVKNFRIFTMQDHFEKADRLVPVLYPHSLLYFISGVLEGGSDVPIVGMERFYDKTTFTDTDFPKVETVRNFVLASSDRAVWSVTQNASAGHRSESKKHGDFDDDAVTLESLVHILKEGF